MLSDYSNPLDGGMADSFNAFDTETIGHLRTAGKWGKFISIVGMVLLGLFLLLLVLGGGAGFIGLMLGGGIEDGAGLAAGAGMTVLFVVYGGMIAFSFYIYYLLYTFSINAIKVADDNDIAAARPAFKSLATVFKIVGILMAIYIGFMAIAVIGALLFGAAAAF